MGYENILLKLSGASISDVNDPFNYAKIDAFVTKVKKLVKEGKHIAIVVGGGNIWRGKNGPEFFMDPNIADYLGMTSTIYNCEVLSSVFKKRRVKHKVYSALKLVPELKSRFIFFYSVACILCFSQRLIFSKYIL